MMTTVHKYEGVTLTAIAPIVGATSEKRLCQPLNNLPSLEDQCKRFADSVMLLPDQFGSMMVDVSAAYPMFGFDGRELAVRGTCGDHIKCIYAKWPEEQYWLDATTAKPYVVQDTSQRKWTKWHHGNWIEAIDLLQAELVTVVDSVVAAREKVLAAR